MKPSRVFDVHGIICGMLSPGFAQSVEQAVTVMDNGYHTELHTYSEREKEFSGNTL